MAWLVALSSRAERNLKRIPAADGLRLLSVIEQMRVDPLSGDVVKLKGQEAFRRCVGSYRHHFLDSLSRTSGRHCRRSAANVNNILM
jgi:hypothetical protein